MKKKIRIIYRFAKHHKWKFFILFFCVVTTTFSGIFYPYVFGRLVDEVFYAKNLAVFLNILAIYGMIFLINQTLHFILNITWAKLMTGFLFDIRKEIFKKVLSYGGKTLTNLNSGDLIYRMGADTEQFMNFIHWNVFYLFASVLNLVISIAFIAYLSLPLAVFALVITPISVYTSRLFASKVKLIYKSISERNGLLSSWLFEIIKGMQDIKLLSATKGVLLEFLGKTIQIIRLQIKANKIEVLSERVNSGNSLVWQIILYVVSAFFIISGNLTLGGFTACVSYFSKCISSFTALNNHIAGISGNMVSIDRVLKIFEESSEILSHDSSHFAILSGNIEFEQAVFSYNDKVDVLKSISFSIEAGKKVAIVGHSGAGKSTIAHLLLRFYELQEGRILIDGFDISKCNIHSLRKQIGIVQQETILFDGSIRYNLVFTDDKSNDNEIFEALKRAHLFDFINSLPDGLDTVIGTEGRALSGGQRQRLAIARIFLKNPKILIFDEATSSLDNEAEQVIRESWDQLCDGRTIIIIAHRLSTIINTDKILVLNDGLIAGYDTHDNLLSSCNTYIQLIREQINVQ